MRAGEIPPPAAILHRIEAELAEIRFIHETTFPGHRLRLVVGWTDDPAGRDPHVDMGETPLDPHRFGPEHLGVLEAGLRDPAAPVVTATVHIPRAPTAAELAGGGEIWTGRRRGARTLLGLSPLLFEEAKHRLERRYERRARVLHSWQKIPRARTTLFRPPLRPAPEGTRPAAVIGFHWLEVGGAERLAFDCVDWALEAGLRVFVVADRRGIHRLADRLPEHADVHFVRIDRYLPRRLWPIFMEHLAERERVRLVHIHHATGLYDCLAHLKALFPDVVTVDSTHIREYADGGYPRVSGVWSSFLDVHHVISHDLARHLGQVFTAGDKVRLGRLLDPAERARRPAPFRLKPGQKTLRVAFVGRMVHQKRPVLVAVIMRRLVRLGRRMGVDVRFDAVGTGPYRPAFERLVARYGLGSRLRLHGADADVGAILSEADVLLLPSANEGLALVCYEAIRAGAMPISTDVGAQAELIPPELLVDRAPIRAARETVATIRRLLTDGAFRDAAAAGLLARYEAIAAEPTAKEVLVPLYTRAAES
ncbi:MAG: glycosyltransferase [Alphaproteobacteria bacterium]|nr:MAG: glycosyltransferase [Alphaproteobacteria bacterium]